MAQNKDLKTRAQIQRELLTLTKQEAELKAKIARYEKEGVENIDEEKKAYADLKKKLEEVGKTSKKINDGRTKEFKKTTKAAEDFGASIGTKLTNAFNDLDKGQQKVFEKSTEQFGNLAQLAEKYADSTEEGADKAAQLTSQIADLQTEVMAAGAGFKNLSDDQAEALNKKIKDMEKTAGDVFQGAFADGADVTGKIFDGMKGAAKESKGLKHYAKGFATEMGISLKFADLLNAAILAIGSAMEDAAAQAAAMQNSLGISNKLANQQIFTWRSLGLSIIGLNDNMTSANLALGQAANNLGIAQGKSKALSRNIAYIAKDTKTSEATLATINQLFQNSAGHTAESAAQLQLGLGSMIEMAGAIPSQVLDDMASNAEMLAKFSDGTAEGMARAAIQAQKLGINLQKAGAIADSLLNLESSIASEFEASVLIGRDLNFDRARNLALNNDIEGAMKDIVDQLGSEEEFNRLNAIQRQALADSIGVGVDDLAAMVKRGGEGAADVDIGVKLQKQANKTLFDILANIGPGTWGTIISGITKAIAGLTGIKWMKSFFAKKFPDTWAKLTGGLKKGFTKWFGKSSFIGKTFTKVGGWLARIGGPLKFLAKGFGGLIAPLLDLTSFFTGGKGSDKKGAGAAGMGFGAIGAIIGSIFPGIGTLIGYGIGSIVGMLVNSIFPKVGQTIANGIDSVIGGIKAMGGWVIDTGKAGLAAGADALAFVTDFFDDVGRSVLNGAKSLGNAALNVYDAVTQSFKDLGATVIDGVTSVFDSMIQAVKDLIADVTDIGGAISDWWSGDDEASGPTSQDFIMRPGQGIKRFSGADTVVGVKDPGSLASLAGNRGMNDSGTKQVALLTTLVQNSNIQMAEIIKTNKAIETAVKNIGTSQGS